MSRRKCLRLMPKRRRDELFTAAFDECEAAIMAMMNVDSNLAERAHTVLLKAQ